MGIEIRGSGGGKSGSGGASTPTEAPNTLQSRATARIIDLVSEGEIEGIVGGLQGIYLDDTPLQNADGSYNFTNVIIDARAGTPDQTSIPGFPAVESVFGVGVEVKNTAPVVRAISNEEATAALVTVRLDGLQSIDTKTGNINPTSVQIAIDVQLDGGGWTDVSPANTVFSGKTSSAYQRSFRIARPGAGEWAIRVRRVTADNSSSTLTNKTYWDSVTEIEDYRLQYPNSALIAYQVDAQSFGGKVPKRLVRGRWLKTRIPTNYDPIARTYTGVWDGTFKTAWHSNPAWVLFECIANDRWGIGEYVPDAFRDKWTLYSIGQYCDESVANGSGGFEPRYTFNFVFATADEALKVLMSIASVFRGMIYWGAAGVTASADRNLDPVKLVTPANVIGGLISWGGGSLKARHTAVIVTWYDPDDFCRPAWEVVEASPEDIARFGYRTMEVVAVGCTSRGQAHRVGKWAIETERSEAESCTWQAAWDHADVYPGEIVQIQDPAYAGVEFGGRIRSVITTVGVTGVVLDRPITLEADKSYSISVVLSDGKVAEREVTTVISTTDTISFSSVMDPEPIPGAIWIMTASDLSPRMVKVIKRVENPGGTFDLTGILHDPTKFDRIEKNLRIEAPSYTALPTGPILPPSDLAADENFKLVSGSAHPATTLSWVLSKDPRVVNYEIQVRPPSLNWQAANPQFTSASSVDLLDLDAGDWGFRVRALDGFGRTSGWTTIESFHLDGTNHPPEDVVNIRAAAYVDNTTSISWDEIADVRAIRFAVRKGDAWESALELGTVAHPPFSTHGNGTYLVKAYTGPDSARIYSVNAAQVEIEGASLVKNVLATRDEAADGWNGVFGGTVGKSGSFIRTGGAGAILSVPDFLNTPDILNMGGQGDGTYTIDKSRYIDAGRVAPCRVTITWKGTGQTATADFLANSDILNNPDVLASGNTDLVEVYPEIAVSQNEVVGDVFALHPTENPANDVFAEADIFSPDISFGPWVKYEPGIYVGQYFRARLVLKSHDPQTVAIALAFSFTVDVPDRLDTWALISGIGTSLNQVAVPDTGLVLVFASNGKTFAEPFNGGPNTDAVPLIQITNTSSQAFDFEVQSLTKSGCTIIPRLAGTPTNAPKTNITIQGW
ncbi:host specificity protein J [Bradyrhizobium sp. CAR08]